MTETTRQSSVGPGAIDRTAMGARVRALRQKLGLTSAELAMRAGISVGIVNQIERAIANPSLRTLERIRTALNVSLTFLLEGQAEIGPDPAFVRRRHARPHLTVGTLGLSKDILSPPEVEDLRFMIVTFPPHARAEEVLTGPGQKAGLVLRGSIRLTVGNEAADLAEGDSFQFSSALPHGVVNESNRAAEILWIMAMPSKPSGV